MKNSCSVERDFCKNCHNHFAQFRPSLKGILVSRRFEKETEKLSVIDDILGCDNINYTELHKFEKHVDDHPIFRAKIDGVHILYAIDKERKLLLFLRSFDNFSRYKKFLGDHREIRRTLSGMG